MHPLPYMNPHSVGPETHNPELVSIIHFSIFEYIIGCVTLMMLNTNIFYNLGSELFNIIYTFSV